MVNREMGPSLDRVEATSGGGGSRGMLATTGLRVAVVALVAIATGANGMAGFTLGADDFIDPPGVSGTAPNPDPSDIIEQINKNEGYLNYYADLNGNWDDDDPGVTTTNLGTLLFKWERDNDEVVSSLPLASSYELVDLISSGKKGGTIHYLGSGGDIVDASLPSWLVVKNGNAGWVVYDLSKKLFEGSFGVDWDGVEDLTFTNVGLKKSDGSLKDISNVQLWGSAVAPPTDDDDPPPPPAVPEPSSLAIWGVCLGALGFVIRRRMVAVAV